VKRQMIMTEQQQLVPGASEENYEKTSLGALWYTRSVQCRIAE